MSRHSALSHSIGLGLGSVLIALASCQAPATPPARCPATPTVAPLATRTALPTPPPAPMNYPIAIEGPPDSIESIRSLLLREHLVTAEQLRFVEVPDLSTRLTTQACGSDHIVLVSRPGGPDFTVTMAADTIPGPAGAPSIRRITEFRIVRGGTPIPVPRSSFERIRPPRFCEQGFARVWALQSRDREYLFVYLVGGDGAEAFGTKWVFSHSGLVTRIVLSGDFMEYIVAI